MDENKSLKMSRYIFGGGILLQILCFVLLSLRGDSGFYFYVFSCGLMVYGLYANLKAKGLRPFKKKRLYATALLLFVPYMGPLIAMAIMFGTPEQGVPAPRWRTVLFSPWMIALSLCLILGLIAFPQFYEFRAKFAHVDLKKAKRHLAVAKEAGRSDDVRKELDKAAYFLAAVRRSGLTDANSSWFVRSSLGDRIIKESELAALEKEIASAKKNNPGRK
jgi:hypothetical protein